MGMIDVQMAGVIRSYVPDREAPLATVHMKDSIYWAESADYMPILDKVLPSPENALRGAGKYFGAKVYANFCSSLGEGDSLVLYRNGFTLERGFRLCG